MTWSNLFAAIVGAVVGTIVGILPGLGSSATVAILIPVAFSMPADSGMIMMIAVYFGAMYGASTTAILLNIPGAPSTVIATADGYPLAQQGRAGPAISITAIGSFFGSMVAILGLMFLITPLSKFALKFGPIEYTAVMIFALVMAATLMGGSLFKGFLSIGLGLTFGLVGIDLQSGVSRFTFGSGHLTSGIDMIVIIIGVFGLGEVLYFLVEQKKNVNSGKE
ncbi:tripartite tricarboxylate transporter permease [Anaerobacillus sp. CMMVII]|uniref:tripartite tricarboxylate transporter permease n=1 Tax=Anaerobacillus sp. CMMVII TaxID=2755588 RepID=UPI0021B8171D|nr:tripartite tricarboxylate transporter permease [Anaerobacillus sp. CMMVII]MCT8140510.1 tripartite tricarboxylate transporter permease [Anaerobacillus sp. CMMVII]